MQLKALGAQYPLSPNMGLDGDTLAALADVANVGMAITVINARAAMNFFMIHLLLVFGLLFFGRPAFRPSGADV